MKVCTCRNCSTQFHTPKVEAFCSGQCRHAYSVINPKPTHPANRDGAFNDNSNTEQE
jgi:hypothetical protein